MMLSFLQPLQTMKISLQRSNNFEPQSSWYQQRIFLSSQPWAGQGRCKKFISKFQLTTIIITGLQVDKMGCAVEACNDHSNELEKRLKTQQTFSKNLMEIVLDTLHTIGMRFPSFNQEDHTKLTQFDFSYKNIRQLKSQFLMNLALFQISKRSLEDEQTFIFPPNCSKNKIARIVQRYKEFFTKEDAEIAQMCQNLLNIVVCKYEKKVQQMQTQKYQLEEQGINKVKMINEGIKATLVVEGIQRQSRGHSGTNSTTSTRKIALQ